MKILQLSTLLLLLVFSGTFSKQAAGKAPLLITDPAYTRSQRLVEVEPGRRLNLYCVGSGSPTVVFDSGLTDPMNVWGFVQPVTARKTRACSYDRAGIGFSDAGRRPATSENIVDDLYRLLKAADVRPPYILVGHSYGGLNIRLFAYKYLSEVAGMVLVDPMSEDQMDGYRKLDPKKRTREQWISDTIEPSLKMRKECIAMSELLDRRPPEFNAKCGFPQYPQLGDKVQEATIAFQMTSTFQKAQFSEEESCFLASADQVRNARTSYGNLPLIILTKAPPAPAASVISSEERARRDSRYRLWVKLHDDIALQSTRGENKIIPNSSHGMPLETPEAVIDAIDHVLEIARH